VERCGQGGYISPVMRFGIPFLLALVLSCYLGCHAIDRDNPVDPAGVDQAVAGGRQSAGLTLVVPLPKTLATVVDSLVARLSGPDMTPVVKPLVYPSPLGPATLTIGAISPGVNRTLTIEGYDLTGRLILSGERRDITIVVGDTTRITIDLRLAIDPSELDKPDTTAAPGDSSLSETPTTGDETPGDSG
jgi:hypothetical protein